MALKSCASLPLRADSLIWRPSCHNMFRHPTRHRATWDAVLHVDVCDQAVILVWLCDICALSKAASHEPRLNSEQR